MTLPGNSVVGLDAHQKALLKCTPSLFLNSNQQRINSVYCQTTPSPIASVNTQFAWNYNILRPFCGKLDFLAFCVALVHGAIFINNCSVNGKYFR